MNPDHRELNRDLDIFASSPLAGSGLPLWLPAGSAIRDELERFAKDVAHADGCVDVHSPVLGKRALFERSGHLPKFADSMFPAMKVGEDELVLRPANCPHHALIYAADQHSYRELPVRLNELAPMFRAELSGVVAGLNRVRQINLDDTHVFCRPDQAIEEAASGLRSALRAHALLGVRVDHVRLSKRDAGDGWLGSEEQWAEAEAWLRQAAEAVLAGGGPSLVEVDGEAAFYGPKLDVQVLDPHGREETIATVQLDFNQPERFDLYYVGEDGRRHRVVMIHRGTIGSMERVVAHLLEQHDGRLPFWLAPSQVDVLPVSVAQDSAARALVDRLRAKGIRAELRVEGSLGSRIHLSRKRRCAVTAVVGRSEADEEAVSVTDVAAGFSGVLPVSGLTSLLERARRDRLPLIPWGEA